MSIVKKNAAVAEEGEAMSPAKKAAATKAAKATKAADTKEATTAPKATAAKATKAVTEAPKAEPKPAQEVLRVGRKQLAAAVREKVMATDKAVSLAVAEIMVVAYEEAVADALASGQDVNLPGFGKFIVKDREAAQRRNPATGEMVDVPAHKAVRFKVGTGLKKSVNGGVEVAEGDED